MPARGHGDDAGAAGPTEQRQQPGHERERAQHHRREGRLEPVGTLGPLREDGAGVVDDDVEPWLGLEDAARPLPGPR